MIKLIKFFLVLAASISLNVVLSMEAPTKLGTVISADNKELHIPLAVAEQSPVLKDMFSSALLSEGSEKKVFANLFTAEQLEKLFQIMNLAYHHRNLKEKALLDLMEQNIPKENVLHFDEETGINNNDIQLFKVADFFDYTPMKKFLARNAAKTVKLLMRSHELRKKLIGSLGKEKALEFLQDIAHYYFLLHSGEYPAVGTDIYYGLSVQDYLDYMPWFFESLVKAVSGEVSAYLKDLQIDDVNALENIPLIMNAKDLDLSENQLHYIRPEAFAKLKELEFLSLSGNPLTQMDPGAFDGLEKLKYLILKNTNLSSEQKENLRKRLPERITIDFE